MVCYTMFATWTWLYGLTRVFPLGRLLQGMGGGALISIIALAETNLVQLRKGDLIGGLGSIYYRVMFAFGGVYGCGGHS
jgi:hypothetical protein